VKFYFDFNGVRPIWRGFAVTKVRSRARLSHWFGMRNEADLNIEVSAIYDLLLMFLERPKADGSGAVSLWEAK